MHEGNKMPFLCAVERRQLNTRWYESFRRRGNLFKWSLHTVKDCSQQTRSKLNTERLPCINYLISKGQACGFFIYLNCCITSINTYYLADEFHFPDIDEVVHL